MRQSDNRGNITMDEIQINQIQPGEELNTLVAKEIMGVKVLVDPIFALVEIHLTGKGEPVYNTPQKGKGITCSLWAKS
jgi:hypothetical protein